MRFEYAIQLSEGAKVGYNRSWSVTCPVQRDTSKQPTPRQMHLNSIIVSASNDTNQADGLLPDYIQDR